MFSLIGFCKKTFAGLLVHELHSVATSKITNLLPLWQRSRVSTEGLQQRTRNAFQAVSFWKRSNRILHQPLLTHGLLKPFGSHLKSINMYLKSKFCQGVQEYWKCSCFCKLAVHAVWLTSQFLIALPSVYSSIYSKLDCDIWFLWGAELRII